MRNIKKRFSIMASGGALALVMSLLAGAMPVYAASIYADSVASFSQGLRKDGSAVLVSRSDPSKALGPEDGAFVSLGFGGELVVKFSQFVGKSLTLSVFETTFGVYPPESADVFVSADGINFDLVGVADNSNNAGSNDPHVSTFDLGDMCIKYVKIVDTTNPGPHSNDADAFDVDAVKAEFTEPCGRLDVEIKNKNNAYVKNYVDVSANTGGNSANGGNGGNGGDAGFSAGDDNKDNDDNEGNSGGNGGNGGIAGDITTGDAKAKASVKNLVNLNKTDIGACGCIGVTNVTIRNYNRAKVKNYVDVDANTGNNYADGGNGGNGGNGGFSAGDDNKDNDDNINNKGGNGGQGSGLGVINTGDAKAKAKVLNLVNKNVTRIK